MEKGQNSKNMQKVKADKLKIGDVLAKDIVSEKGITILKKGTELTDKFIANIKKNKR